MFHSIGHIDWLINLGHQFKITDALANSGTELMGVDHAGKSPAVLKGSNYSLDSNKQLSLALLSFFLAEEFGNVGPTAQVPLGSKSLSENSKGSCGGGLVAPVCRAGVLRTDGQRQRD